LTSKGGFFGANGKFFGQKMEQIVAFEKKAPLFL
jgi:hypothetical protein